MDSRQGLGSITGGEAFLQAKHRLLEETVAEECQCSVMMSAKTAVLACTL